MFHEEALVAAEDRRLRESVRGAASRGKAEEAPVVEDFFIHAVLEAELSVGHPRGAGLVLAGARRLVAEQRVVQAVRVLEAT